MSDPVTFTADRQGEQSDEARTNGALQDFIRDCTVDTAIYLESCIHCGLCAEACQFYVQTGDPRYTPVWKLEPFKQAYKREAGPFSFFYKALNLKHRVTVDELEAWQHLLYDACTLCGRCSLVCPMGIDVASLIGMARHGMHRAGLVPKDLYALAQRAEDTGSPLGATPELFRETLNRLASEHSIDIPLDRAEADVLVTLSAAEISDYPESIVAMARVMNHAGYDWTYSSNGFEATNFGMLSGNTDWQRDMSMNLINAAIACKAGTVVVPECGHAYGAFRWQAANMYGEPLPFRVLHIAELMAEAMEQGNLRVTPVEQSASFHDPCQVSRRGGATQAPRTVLKQLGVELHELPGGGELNWCCGGGGGVMQIGRADELRYAAFRLKIDQVEQAGADRLYTSCNNCRLNFSDCGEHFHWDTRADSLLELVADNLAD